MEDGKMIVSKNKFENGSTSETYIGYRVMMYDPETNTAISGYDKVNSLSVFKGQVIDYGKGHYLGNSVDFVMGYYGGMADDNVLLKVEFDKDDVLKGELDNLAYDGGEIIVSRSKILDFKPFIDPDLEEGYNIMSKFDKTFDKLMEMLAGDGGVFGDTGDHGGALGNPDFYAPGDARVPTILGAKEVSSKKKKNKKKKKNDSGPIEVEVPIQRRVFPNS